MPAAAAAAAATVILNIGIADGYSAVGGKATPIAVIQLSEDQHQTNLHRHW